MKTTLAISALLLAATSVMAAPTDPTHPGHGGSGGGGNGGGHGGGGNGGGGNGGGGTTPYDPCSGLYDSALCCATDVLGVANLDCAAPPAVLTSAAQFKSTCAKIGQRARCCVLPVLGQAVLCQAPAGI